MNEIANIGKMISILATVILYFYVFAWSVDHAKKCNRNATWEVVVSRAFIGFHIGILIAWFIWSWTQ